MPYSLSVLWCVVNLVLWSYQFVWFFWIVSSCLGGSQKSRMLWIRSILLPVTKHYQTGKFSIYMVARNLVLSKNPLSIQH